VHDRRLGGEQGDQGDALGGGAAVPAVTAGCMAS
jgi:hypothetical protein